MLIAERIVATIFFACSLVGMWIDALGLFEGAVLIALSNIWLATIDMRKSPNV